MNNQNDIFDLLGCLVEYTDCGLRYGRVIHISRENDIAFATIKSVVDGFGNTEKNKVLLKKCHKI